MSVLEEMRSSHQSPLPLLLIPGEQALVSWCIVLVKRAVIVKMLIGELIRNGILRFVEGRIVLVKSAEEKGSTVPSPFWLESLSFSYRLLSDASSFPRADSFPSLRKSLPLSSGFTMQ